MRNCVRTIAVICFGLAIVATADYGDVDDPRSRHAGLVADFCLFKQFRRRPVARRTQMAEELASGIFEN